MGVVYRSEDPRLKREVALKVMLPQFTANPDAKARFVREARTQGKVEHDYVAAIFAGSSHANRVAYPTGCADNDADCLM